MYREFLKDPLRTLRETFPIIDVVLSPSKTQPDPNCDQGHQIGLITGVATISSNTNKQEIEEVE